MRHPRTAATVVALAFALAGCGGSGTSNGGNTFGNALTIYTALPTDGPQGRLMQSFEYGETLAVTEAHNVVDGRLISPVYVSDASGSVGGWDTTDVSNAATTATQNLDAVAYIGDFDSAATATSLPITNAADLLQVSPASPYIGLTDPSVYDVKGEPASYYPSGIQTFARLVPSDLQEASATASFMSSVGVTSVYVLEDNDPGNTPFDSVIGTMVGADAAHAEITLVGTAQTDTATDTTLAQYAPVVKAIAATHADAVFVASAADPGVEALWQELYAKLPGVKLFAPSTLATGPFREALGAAARATYVTSPILPLNQYGPQAQGVLRRYREEFRGSAPTAWSLYGYEAMESVLAAIKKAGKHANDRRTVVSAYFHLGWRDSVIGRYRITPSGDTSQARFVGYRAGADGQLIEIRRHLGGA